MAFAPTPGELPLAFGTIQFALGANCGVRTEVFEAVGGFSGDFAEFGCGEDVDFSIRVQAAGHELRYVPTRSCTTGYRDSLGQLARQSYRYGRATTFNYARHSDRLGLSRTTTRQTLGYVWLVVPYVVNLVRGRERRGRWIRLASFLAGEAVESVRQRVWHLG